jgi:hypothetical protein
MKITFLTPALVAILGLALAGAPVSVQAQTTTNTPAAAAPATATAPKAAHMKSDKTNYEGTITALDAGSVTVTTTKAPLVLAIAPTTKFAIMKGHKKTPATAADFAVGDKVTGSYTTDATGALTAYSVHKKALKTAAADPAAAPAAPPAPAAH